jgi:threonylcarbamoyladenosine tRNA methylthiotransferase MtaB
MRVKNFFVKTLGCKVNQVESAFIIEKLTEEGFSFSSEEEAEILILNSCIVTEKAEAETRKIIKKWFKLKPLIIVVTGCYAQKFFKESVKLFNNNKTKFLILGQKEKFKIAEILKIVLNDKENSSPYVFVEDISEEKTCYPVVLNNFFGHSRAFVKVQDGCDNFCSYCIVPYVRGSPRSVPVEYILKQIEIFIENGYREIVLTGIHLGKWGVDLNPPQKLTDLMLKIEEFLNTFNKEFILRLSSLEVNEIDKDFLEFIKNSKFIAPHFHIPLQSGSNKILRLMNRHYTREKYRETLEKLYEIYPYATFGADVIVGFPGEKEEDFRDTYELIKNSPINWLHIFPYSERPGTPAEKINPKVSQKEIEKRKKLLKDLIEEKRKELLKKELGKVRRAVVENFDKNKNMWKSLSENYITTYLNLDELNIKDEDLKGKIIKIRFSEMGKDHLTGDFLKLL